jgi:hypothetical protein
MKVEIDVKALIRHKISPNQYMLAVAIHKKDIAFFSQMRDVINNDFYFKEDILKLFQRDILVKGYSPDSIKFNFEAAVIEKIFDEEKDISETDVIKCFEEFKSAYPTKTPDGRRLHGNIKICQKKYEALIRSKGIELHKLIIKCVALEQNERKLKRSEKYYKMMLSYINQEGWLLYESDVNNPITIPGLGSYGTKKYEQSSE